MNLIKLSVFLPQRNASLTLLQGPGVAWTLPISTNQKQTSTLLGLELWSTCLAFQASVSIATWASPPLLIVILTNLFIARSFSKLSPSSTTLISIIGTLPTKEAMLHLHWHFHLFLKLIFNLFSQFAMGFNNVNVMSQSCPLSKLNTKPLRQALVTMKAFKDHLSLAHSMNSPIQILAASVSRYSISLNSTFVCALGINHKSTSPSHEIVQNNHRNLKHDSATPDNKMTLTADHHQKKLSRPGAYDLDKKPRLVSDMGMFFLSKPDMKATDIFPKDMPKKICADFTCKG